MLYDTLPSITHLLRKFVRETLARGGATGCIHARLDRTRDGDQSSGEDYGEHASAHGLVGGPPKRLRGETRVGAVIARGREAQT